ncbi:DUF805 domain-containing protein [Emticicia sp. BO119]|uniref:DUF805 domain-containing protein n=1 Tax=Emticicia sp. BO119 TaxID=2757768 RepID=UPI0015F08D5A|nr:DUF805 domain-containing protein [Emticicia sp. BO119]MBA4852638.1 DUF805 domain-containing protein [Emticicia sp. BO119]
MFKAPFSFSGRIRRTEYGLSCIILCAVNFFCNLIILFGLGSKGNEWLVIFIILYIPMWWFSLAQGAKRCHDLDRSGWYQIIPFYVLWMLFQDGEVGENEYGLNPKGIRNDNSYDEQISQIGKSLKS